jgi:hypothetical protein
LDALSFTRKSKTTTSAWLAAMSSNGRKCDLGFPSRMRSEHSDEQSAE